MKHSRYSQTAALASTTMVCLIVSVCLAQEQASEAVTVTVVVDASQVQRQINPRLLGGSNVAAWIQRDYYASPTVRQLMAELKPGVIRLPGGSWGDVMFWNGHGVRGPDGQVDPTRIGPDGYPAVDYSDYAPSFLLDEDFKPRSDGWHGHIDVKGLHEFIRDIPGCEQMVIVNAGSGRAIDAAEWVRWANRKMGYNVRWWEVGNELDGSWELGHVQRDGTVLTAEMYARRFAEFASEMKAVDPAIMVGGAASGTDDGGFAEVLLRDAGRHVDFLSVHIYPGNPMYDDQQQIQRIGVVSDCAQRLRRWIEKYQPERVGKIPLAITEWGLPAYRGQSELLGTLWASLFIHEAVRSGYDVLNHWLCDELVRHANPGRRDASTDWLNGPYLRGPEYYALWLWNNYSGDRLIRSTQQGSELVHSIATRSDNAVYVTLVNTSREQQVQATIGIEGFAPGASGERAAVSHREYFRSYVSGRILWSRGAKIEPIQVGKNFQVVLPPFSIMSIRIPDEKSPPMSELAVRELAQSRQEPGQPQLVMILPEHAYANDRVEGWVLAVQAGTEQPYSGILPPATISVQGDAQADRSTVRLAECAGRFFIEPASPGQVTVTARSGELSCSASIDVRPSIPRAQIFWEFEEPELTRQAGYDTHFRLSSDTTIRANQRVARVELSGEEISQDKRLLLRLDRLPPPERLNRANIRGVVFDMMVGADFVCEDPDARVTVIMQSPADWWMPLGSFPLAQARQWRTFTAELTQKKHIDAVAFAHNVWFIIDSSKPARGSIFLDRVGFMVR